MDARNGEDLSRTRQQRPRKSCLCSLTFVPRPLKPVKSRGARGRGYAQDRTQGVSEHGLRHITRMGTRSRQGRPAWNVAHSAAAACHIAPQSSALPLSACHITLQKQPRIEASPLSGEVPRPKSKLRPYVANFLRAAYGRSGVFGSSGWG
jgi:hypothetical protein